MLWAKRKNKGLFAFIWDYNQKQHTLYFRMKELQPFRFVFWKGGLGLVGFVVLLCYTIVL